MHNNTYNNREHVYDSPPSDNYATGVDLSMQKPEKDGAMASSMGDTGSLEKPYNYSLDTTGF